MTEYVGVFCLRAAKFFESGNVLSQSGHIDLTGEGFKTLGLKISALVTCGEAKKKTDNSCDLGKIFQTLEQCLLFWLFQMAGIKKQLMQTVLCCTDSFSDSDLKV